MSTPTDPKLGRLKKVLGEFEGRVRVRVGALLFDEPEDPSALVLVEHDGIWGEDTFWTPPGGGVEFGEGLEEALRREVLEETGLEIEVGPLCYTLDFVRVPLHAVSFYFACTVPGRLPDTFAPGTDPEHGDDQLIRAVRLIPFGELPSLKVYPEGLGARLAEDAPGGFRGGTRYLGTLR